MLGKLAKYSFSDLVRMALGLAWEKSNGTADTLFRYMGAFGIVRGPALYLLSATCPPARGRLHKAAVPGTDIEVFLRLGTSDISVFNGMFRWQEYAVDLEQEPELILDGGAYIGLSAIYFSTRYPGARIISVEASEKNYALLVRNTKRFDNIETVHAALWPQPGSLAIADPGTGAWGLQVEDPGQQAAGAQTSGAQVTRSAVPAITIPDLIRDYHIDRINLLKLDIEGSEKELFSQPAPWLDQVDALCVELHDWFKPGCARTFFEAVKDFRVEAWRGENVLVAREKAADYAGSMP
jgi:FkbM family methyltransferase